MGLVRFVGQIRVNDFSITNRDANGIRVRVRLRLRVRVKVRVR